MLLWSPEGMQDSACCSPSSTASSRVFGVAVGVGREILVGDAVGKGITTGMLVGVALGDGAGEEIGVGGATVNEDWGDVAGGAEVRGALGWPQDIISNKTPREAKMRRSNPTARITSVCHRLRRFHRWDIQDSRVYQGDE